VRPAPRPGHRGRGGKPPLRRSGPAAARSASDIVGWPTSASSASPVEAPTPDRSPASDAAGRPPRDRSDRRSRCLARRRSLSGPSTRPPQTNPDRRWCTGRPVDGSNIGTSTGVGSTSAERRSWGRSTLPLGTHIRCHQARVAPARPGGVRPRPGDVGVAGDGSGREMRRSRPANGPVAPRRAQIDAGRGAVGVRHGNADGRRRGGRCLARTHRRRGRTRRGDDAARRGASWRWRASPNPGCASAWSPGASGAGQRT
jgi:hypothetical protein